MNTETIAAKFDHLITEERCQQLLVELVQVPSPLTGLIEQEPQLRAFIRSAVELRLGVMGIEAIRFDDMGNLIADIGAASSGRSLMLISNAMNQPQATMANAYSGEVVDGAPYGLPGMAVLGKGASEQKSSMAAMLAALEAVLASDVQLSGHLIFLCCVSGETGRHDAIQNVVEVEGVRADIALLGGSSLQLMVGNRGRVDIDVEVHGAPAHSSKPHEGCDAIAGAIAFIESLRRNIDLSREHPDLGPATLAVTRLRSFPESTHTIQDRVDITLDRRLLPEEDPDTAFEEVQAVARQVEAMRDPASGKPWTLDVQKGAFMYPSLTDRDSVVFKLMSAAFEEALGRLPEVSFAPNAFDQGYLNHVGIDTLNFGAGESRYAHTDLDMASVTRVREAALVYARAIIDYLGE